MEYEWVSEINSQLAKYDFSGWQKYFEALNAALPGITGGGQGESLLGFIGRFASGEISFNAQQLPNFLKEAFLSAVSGNAVLLCIIPALALVFGVAQILLDGSGNKRVVELIFLSLCAADVVLIVNSCIASASAAFADLTGFFDISLPVLTTVLAASGGVASAGMLRPLMAFLSSGMSVAYGKVILPMVCIFGMLTLAFNLCGKTGLKHLSGFIKAVCKWVMGLGLTLYLGILTLQGMSVVGADSLGLRTTKYMLDKSLPMFGSSIAATIDTVKGCAVLIKNAAGAAAIIIIAFYALLPVIRIVVCAFSLRLCAAVCAPLCGEGNTSIPQMLSDMAEVLDYLVICVIVAAIVLILSTALIISIR